MLIQCLGQCRLLKDESCFNIDRTKKKRGFQSLCQDCKRLRCQTPEYKAKNNVRTANRDPKKKHAAGVMKWLVESGKRERRTCFICGKKKTEFHHWDYDLPDQAIDLCRKCHKGIEHEGWDEYNPTELALAVACSGGSMGLIEQGHPEYLCHIANWLRQRPDDRRPNIQVCEPGRARHSVH